MDTTYSGVSYAVLSLLDGFWAIREYAETSLDSYWEVQARLQTKLDSSWGSLSYVTPTLLSEWESQQYAMTPLNGYWRIAYQSEVTTGNSYCVAPVKRAKVIDCLITTCECDEE